MKAFAYCAPGQDDQPPREQRLLLTAARFHRPRAGGVHRLSSRDSAWAAVRGDQGGCMMKIELAPSNEIVDQKKVKLGDMSPTLLVTVTPPKEVADRKKVLMGDMVRQLRFVE